MKTVPTYHEIACQQAMLYDASIFSQQWTVFPTALTAELSPEDLLKRYLACVRVCTLFTIHPHISAKGVEFRLLGTQLSLISFLPPPVDDAFLVLRICGGLLVNPHRRNRGELRFGLESVSGGMRISSRLSEFFPLILGCNSPSFVRFWLYRLTQATLHRLVALRFLALLCRELAGCSAAVRIVNISVPAGRPV